MAKKVCLDAGHYGKYNRCPNNASYYESEIMWKLHLLQKKYLEEYGIEVIVTRADQTKDLALTTRGQKAKGCDLFISNHTNAVGGGMNDSIDYVIAYHLTNDNSTNCDDISKDFAQKIAKVVADTMGATQGSRIASRLSDTDRNGDGVMNDNYYAVLNGARSVEVPGIIMEHSFHTNSKVVNWLLSDSNLDKLAKAEAKCIADYLGVEKKQTLYRVQVGAFTLKFNATNMLKKVQKSGFDGYVKYIKPYYKVQLGAFSVKSNAENYMKKVKDAGFNAFITTEN